MHDPEQRPSASSPATGEDAVRITRSDPRAARGSLLYKAAAAVLTIGAAGYLGMLWLEDGGSVAQTQSQFAAPAQGPATLPRAEALSPISPAAVQAQDGLSELASADLADYVDPNQPAPTMQDVIRKLNEAGIHSGLGAFNPPGTSPPLIGLAVPEDFPLPPGYVRHYQTTDDGQDIEAILMFSPDFNFFDANGRRIEVPENRVVPPELAPPGLKPRTITVPPPLPERGRP